MAIFGFVSRRLLVLVLGLFVLVDASLLVGWVAARAGDDEITWEVAALTFTGLATLMLAFATFGLAKQTQKDVDASTKAANAASHSADVGASSFAAAILAQDPTKTPSVDKVGIDGRHHVRVFAQLRNVGSGLAIVENPRLLTSIPPGTTMRAEVRGSAVPANELAYLEFAVVFDGDSEAGSFEHTLTTAVGVEFDVRYRDMNGEQLSRTKARMEYDTSRGWDYANVELYRGEETSPYGTRARSVTIAPPAAS